MTNNIKLSANEIPFNLPDQLKEKVNQRINNIEFNRYPDENAVQLKEEIAKYTGVPTKNIVVGNGSDELLLLNILAFTTQKKKIVIPVPTFSMYEYYARESRADVVKVNRKDNLSLDWDRIFDLNKCRSVGMYIFCSPNNPTGETLDFNKLERLLKETDKLVIVDEAYYEFAGETIIDLINKYSNLIVIRTFSKAFGLAGLRVGYLAACESLVQRLEEVRSPYNVNAVSQQIACLTLQHSDSFKNIWKKIKNERTVLYKKMKSIEGVTPYPSEANFISFKTRYPEKDVFTRLKSSGISIRFLSNLPVCGDLLRVTVGTKEENQNFIDALGKICEEG